MGEPDEFSVYAELVGLLSAEVYQCEGVYSLFLVGDQMTCFLGSYKTLGDCQEEIRWLLKLDESLAPSADFSSVSETD